MDQQDNKKINFNLIEYKVDELQKGQERQENKIDAISDKLTKIIFATPQDVQHLKDYVDKTFIKRTSLNGWKAVGIAVASAIAVALTVGLVKLAGANI